MHFPGFPGLRQRTAIAAGDAVEVGGRVDIVGAACVAAFDERDQVRAGAKERPGPLVPGGRRDDLGPVLAGQQHWAEVIATATGDQGARTFLRARPDLVTPVDCGDTGRPDDIDTPADLARIAAATERA